MFFLKCFSLLQTFIAGPQSCRSFWKTAIMKRHLIFINRSLKLKSLQQQQQIVVVVVVFKASLSASIYSCFMCFTCWMHTHTNINTHRRAHTTLLPRPPCVTTTPKINLHRKENIQSSAAQPITAGRERKRSPGEPRGDGKRVSGFKKREREGADQPLAVFSQLPVLSRLLQHHWRAWALFHLWCFKYTIWSGSLSPFFFLYFNQNVYIKKWAFLLLSDGWDPKLVWWESHCWWWGQRRFFGVSCTPAALNRDCFCLTFCGLWCGSVCWLEPKSDKTALLQQHVELASVGGWSSAGEHLTADQPVQPWAPPVQQNTKKNNKQKQPTTFNCYVSLVIHSSSS